MKTRGANRNIPIPLTDTHTVDTLAGMTDLEAVDFVAAKIGGGPTAHGRFKALADALGVSPQAVNNWRDPARGISAAMRPVLWAMVNDHGGNLSREWLMPRSVAA